MSGIRIKGRPLIPAFEGGLVAAAWLGVVMTTLGTARRELEEITGPHPFRMALGTIDLHALISRLAAGLARGYS
jgi:hypothetical protein